MASNPSGPLSVGEATARNFDPERDLPFCAAAAAAFAAEAAVKFLPVNPEHVENVLARPNVIIGIAEVEGRQVGAVGFEFSPYAWNEDVLVAGELFWWVDPAAVRSGAALALKKWAKIALAASGAHAQRWSAIHTSPDAVHAIYRRDKLVPLQIDYWGSL